MEITLNGCLNEEIIMSEDPVEFSIKVEPGDSEDPVTKIKNTMKEFKETLPYQMEIQLLKMI